MFDFVDFKIIDFIDIVLVAVLLYYIYKLVKGAVAINIFIGIVIVYAIWKLIQELEMKMLSTIFGGFMNIGLIALVIVFQQEIRKFLLVIGSTNFAKHFKFLKQDHHLYNRIDLKALLKGCQKMSASRTGAIIVIKRTHNLDFVKNTGDKMDIMLNEPILESIFYKNSPLHDGALLIEEDKIVATRVILPINKRKNIPSSFGLRHRAAVGITERTDALAIVVSEETGAISYIKNGKFYRFKDLKELEFKINADLSLN